MLKHFHLDSVKACVVTFNDHSAIHKAAEHLRHFSARLPIITRASNLLHQHELEDAFGEIFFHWLF